MRQPTSQQSRATAAVLAPGGKMILSCTEMEDISGYPPMRSISTESGTKAKKVKERLRPAAGRYDQFLLSSVLCFNFTNCGGRDTELPAFVWDGSQLVPSDPRTLARRQDRLPSLSSAPQHPTHLQTAWILMSGISVFS